MDPKKRYFARRMIMQALYEKELSNNDTQAIINGFLSDSNKIKFDQDYFQTSFTQIMSNIIEIDSLYIKYIDRDISAVDPIPKAILRLGCFELKYKLDIPYKVVINEAVNLAKAFGSEDSHKFINASLDKLAGELRNSEKNKK